MDKELANYFFEETSKALGFLVYEHSFAEPQYEIDDKVHFAFVTFLGKNVAIECSFDGREGDTTCRIARVSEGKNATYRDAVDERDKHGVRVREHLSSFFVRRGVRGRLFTKTGGLELHQRIKTTLSDYARMLRLYGQEVLKDSPTVFS